MKAITMPYPYFVDLDGNPLDNGKIYIGVDNANPIANPVQVYADIEGTIPLAQPIRTSFGYPSQYGKPVNIYVNTTYSLLVRDANDEMIITEPSSAVLTPESGSSNAVDDFGAINDGTGNNADALNTIFGGTVTGKVFLPAGTYNTDGLIVIDCENLEVWGVEGATIITSNTLVELAQVVRMDNVHFHGITFQLTTTSGSASNGVVFGDSPDITSGSFRRCWFTAPNCKAGGFVMSGTDSGISKFRFVDCWIKDVGGKGFFLEAGGYYDVHISSNSIEITGQYTGEDGDGLSIGDGGERAIWVNDNRINDVSTNVFYVGQVANATIANNRIGQIGRPANLLSSPATLGNKENINVVGNIVDARIDDGGVSLFEWVNCTFSNNKWLLTDAFSLTDCVHVKCTGETIDSTGANAVYITGDSENNEWIGGLITNADAIDDAGNATILTDGAGVGVNRFVSVELYKTAAGDLFRADNGADDPDFIYCSGDSLGGGDLTAWTPEVFFTDMADVAYTSEGYYRKDGSVVTFTCKVAFTNQGSGSASDAVRIQDLPFIPSPTIGDHPCGTLYYNAFQSISDPIIPYMDTFTNRLVFYLMGSTGPTSLRRGDIQNSAFLMVSGQYFTDEI